MRGRLYIHVRFQEGGAGGKEALKLDVSIFDEHGVSLVEVTGFTMKRVNEKVMQALAAKDGRAAAAGRGEAAGAAGPKGRSLPALRDAIQPGEGVEAFRRILAREGLRQVIVSTHAFEPRVRKAKSATSAKLLERMEKKTEAAQPTHARPSVKTDFEAPRNELEEQVAAIWQRVLGIEKVGVHDDFIELGGHSLLAIQIMSQMREAFQVALPADVILNSPTVASLSEATLQALAEAADGDLLAELLEEVEQLPEAAEAEALQAGEPA